MYDKHDKFSGFGSHQNGTTEIQTSNFAPVYYYLLTGIALLAAVFLFLPRVSIG